jgi:uncharacterized protein
MSYIGTRYGRMVNIVHPNPNDISIEDIADALSKICRFGGHCDPFYSVAQHSVLVAANMPRAGALEGLLHDASEAYLGDVVAPLKHQPELAGYRKLEARMMEAISVRFGLGMEHWHPHIKVADARAYVTEVTQRTDRNVQRDPICIEFQPYEVTLEEWDSDTAKKQFLHAFNIARSWR